MRKQKRNKSKTCDAIYYAAVAVAKADAPQEVIEQLDVKPCGCCGMETYVVPKTFAEVTAMAKQMNRPVLVLCNDCTDEQLEKEPEFMAACLPDEGIANAMRRYRAEKN